MSYTVSFNINIFKRWVLQRRHEHGAGAAHTGCGPREVGSARGGGEAAASVESARPVAAPTEALAHGSTLRLCGKLLPPPSRFHGNRGPTLGQRQ